MADPVDALILDLLEWLVPQPRSYSEVISAWRTSCPRLPVWEDANDRGFLARERHEAGGTFIGVTPLGRDFLWRHRGVGPPTDALAENVRSATTPE